MIPCRISQDEYFMILALLVSTRSTCLRNRVGAVLVKDKRIISTGYNGSPRGMKHCEEVGCLREELKVPSGERHEICRAVHAEMNCVIWASLNNSSTAGATLYVTHFPCSICARILINAGIKRIVYFREYNDKFSKDLLSEAGIVMRKIDSERLLRNFEQCVDMIRKQFVEEGIYVWENR